MYKISEYSNKIKYLPSGEVFNQDDRDERYLTYLVWLKNENAPEKVDFFEEEETEKLALEQLSYETAKYIQRSKDGQEAYAKISAEFRLAKLNGQITEEAHAIVEKILIPVRNEVLAGQWMSAINELISIGSELIGESLFYRLYSQIDNYIQYSYTAAEINSEKNNSIKNK